MTFNNEIEELKAQIKVLEKKVVFLEEIEKQPRMNLQQEGGYAVVSYHDKVYYRLMGVVTLGVVTFSWYIKKGVSVGYPVPTLMMVNDAETERLLEGLYYNYIQVKKEKEQQIKDAVRESVKWCEENPEKSVEDYLTPQERGNPIHKEVENEIEKLQEKNWYVDAKTNLKPHWEPKLQTPEQTAQSLKEAFVKAQQTEKWKETQRKIDGKNPPEFLKFELRQNLTDLIYDWWEDVFAKNSNDDMENCIGRLVYWIEEWLPKEQSASGSQNVDVEFLVEGFNDAIKKIKGKLR